MDIPEESFPTPDEGTVCCEIVPNDPTSSMSTPGEHQEIELDTFHEELYLQVYRNVIPAADDAEAQDLVHRTLLQHPDWILKKLPEKSHTILQLLVFAGNQFLLERVISILVHHLGSPEIALDRLQTKRISLDIGLNALNLYEYVKVLRASSPTLSSTEMMEYLHSLFTSTTGTLSPQHFQVPPFALEPRQDTYTHLYHTAAQLHNPAQQTKFTRQEILFIQALAHEGQRGWIVQPPTEGEGSQFNKTLLHQLVYAGNLRVLKVVVYILTLYRLNDLSKAYQDLISITATSKSLNFLEYATLLSLRHEQLDRPNAPQILQFIQGLYRYAENFKQQEESLRELFQMISSFTNAQPSSFLSETPFTTFLNRIKKDKNMFFCAFRPSRVNSEQTKTSLAHRFVETQSFEKIRQVFSIFAEKRCPSPIPKQYNLHVVDSEGLEIKDVVARRVSAMAFDSEEEGRQLTQFIQQVYAAHDQLSVLPPVFLLPPFDLSHLNSAVSNGLNFNHGLLCAFFSLLVYRGPSAIQKCLTELSFEHVFLFHQETDTFGFIAHNSDLAVIAFRGSVGSIVPRSPNWKTNSAQSQIPIPSSCNTENVNLDGVFVHSGFWNASRCVWNTIRATLSTLQARPIYITGHSLGGALSIMTYLSFLIQPVHFLNGVCRINGIWTFGQPKCGNRALVNFIDTHKECDIFRVVFGRDPVPDVPPTFMGYDHLGIYFGIFKDPKKNKYIVDYHGSGFSEARSTKVLAPAPVSHHSMIGYFEAMNWVYEKQHHTKSLTTPTNDEGVLLTITILGEISPGIQMEIRHFRGGNFVALETASSANNISACFSVIQGDILKFYYPSVAQCIRKTKVPLYNYCSSHNIFLPLKPVRSKSIVHQFGHRQPAPDCPGVTADFTFSRKPLPSLSSFPLDFAPWGAGNLSVTICAASNLASKDANGFSDPFAVIWLGQQGKYQIPKKNSLSKCYRTKTIPKTLNPVWNEEISFSVHDCRSRTSVLHIALFDEDFIGADYLGQVEIPLNNPANFDSLPPQPVRALGQYEREFVSGTLTIKLSIQQTPTTSLAS